MKDISEDTKMVGDIIMRALNHYSIKHATKEMPHFNIIIDEFWSDYFNGNQLYEKSTVDN